ncbi:8782_t:CDS:2, partial [Cetraspora pellucida]
RRDKTMVLQLDYEINDDFKLLWNLLFYISKKEEFKNKSAGFKKHNDILDKEDNGDENNNNNIDKLENIEYFDIITKIVENMEKNNIVFDTELILNFINNIDTILRTLKAKINLKRRT